MYATSTQKKSWTFPSLEAIDAARRAANEKFRSKYESVIRPDEQSLFLSPEEESTLRKIVTETGIRFAEDFSPSMWLSVRWIAFAYFKRFYLHHSTMEYSPKSVMMACFYLAAKVDEFNLSIDEFVGNLKSGSPKSNAETILSLEPEIMLKLNYHLTVHAPFRPFEGHLIEMKTRSLLGFDLEQVRPHANDFFKKALLGDAMLLYPPSQIALSALKYALQKLDKADDLIRDQFLYKLLEIDTWHPQSSDIAICDKLIARLDAIIRCVIDGSEPISKQANTALQARMQQWVLALADLEERLKSNTVAIPGEQENSLSNSGFNSDNDDD
ncbi:hypothetical protein AB6A40_000352 [Gnathostoma spinigerum]|uniref:Cyclin H n=1 Tax=Gnathostoma spinigerum TaxID=75299 RepID=A0ABD6E200_9BILA